MSSPWLGPVRVSRSCRSTLLSTLLFCVVINMALLHNWVRKEEVGEVGPRASGSVKLEYRRIAENGGQEKPVRWTPTAFPLRRFVRRSAAGHHSTRRTHAGNDAAKKNATLVSSVECSRMEAWTDVCV